MKLETGMLGGCGARSPRDSDVVPGEGQLRPSGQVPLLPKSPPVLSAAGQRALIPPASFSVTGRAGLFVVVLPPSRPRCPGWRPALPMVLARC